MAQTQRLTNGSRNTSIVDNGADDRVVTLHRTEVVRVTKDKIILKNGGWITRTTTDRMNQASGTWSLGYRVYRRGDRMYCDYRGQLYTFIDTKLELPR